MIAPYSEPLQYLLLHDISWNGYETMLRELEGRHIRITYDKGVMEIMAVSHEHEFDGDVDPPPDLTIEVEVTRSALDRMGNYAALGIREVWRSDGEYLRVNVLGPNGKYREKQHRRAFPFLPTKKVQEFLKRAANVDETTLMRSFVKWVREEIAPAYTKKNGKK